MNQYRKKQASYSCVTINAFTLIEVLTVIAILIIMSAIALPALTKAKDRANAAKCANNLRQLALALTSYASENEDRYPWITYSRQHRQWAALQSYVGGVKSTFRCPSAKGRSPLGAVSISAVEHLSLQFASTITNLDGAKWTTDYKLNDNTRFFNTNESNEITGNRFKLSSFNSSEAVIAWDNIDWIPRHFGYRKVNFGFLDGHVTAYENTGNKGTLDPAKALTGTYTVDSNGSYPFWNWGFPEKYVDSGGLTK